MRNLKLKTIFLLVASGFLLVSAGPAAAQELNVGIYPPVIQVDAIPPALVNTVISIQNGSDQTATYSIFLMPFKDTKDKNGETEYDRSLLTTYKSFFGKVRVMEGNKVVTQVSLAPHQTKEINLRIAVPKGETPRDYYFAILFISNAGGETDQSSFIGARAGVASNVLVSLGPKSKSSGFIKEFSSPKFVTRGPIDFTLNLANTSLHYVTINGNIVIKNIFDQTVGNIDFPRVNILASSERFIESEDNKSASPRIAWNEKFLLGIYKAELNVALSEDGPILKRQITFIAFPIEVLLGILVAIALTIGIVRRVRSKQIED